jgi:uncharacterized membrane protein
MRTTSRDRVNGVALGFLVVLGILLAANRVGVIVSQRFHGFIDERYADHQAGVLMHAALGALYILPTPLLFSKRLRAKYLSLHRWFGRVALISGSLLGINALVIQTRLQHGLLAVHGYLFAVLFLASIAFAYTAIRKGDVLAHQRWTMRAFANAIGVSVGVRIVSILCFVAFGVSDKTPTSSLSASDIRLVSAIMFLSAWLGTLIPVLVAEVMIARGPAGKRKLAARERATASDTKETQVVWTPIS